MNEKWRMKRAKKLDNETEACWADLVTWALWGYGNINEIKQNQPPRLCMKDMKANGSCWCGKFKRIIGRKNDSKEKK